MTLACLDCLASQSFTELGPAQPQLVFYFIAIGVKSALKSAGSKTRFYVVFLLYCVLKFLFHLWEADIQENTVKSGILQIDVTPPPPKKFWNGYFLADPDFKIPPPLIFLERMVFYISSSQLKKAFVRTWKIFKC